MKRYSFLMIILMAAAMLIFQTVLADDEISTDPDEYEETETLIVPDGSAATVTKDYIYFTGIEQPGIDMTADNQSVSATVSGDVISVFGGASVMTKGSGKAVLNTGMIQGGYGISAYISGGSFEAETDDIFADDDTALDILELRFR